MPESYALVTCSGDTSDFTPCQSPANWMLLPYDGAEPELRSPFCNECAQVLNENFPDANPDGFQMTIRQAHLWVAQGRPCICPHPGRNCEEPASVVLKSDEDIMAVCLTCIACGNGFLEGFREVINGFYLE